MEILLHATKNLKACSLIIKQTQRKYLKKLNLEIVTIIFEHLGVCVGACMHVCVYV